MSTITREKIQADALNILEQYNRVGLGISMGVGKTRIAIKHILKNYEPFLKVLVVVPKNSIKDSWIDELNKMNIYDRLIDHIDFVTYLSLNKKKPNDYNIIYLDECHSLLYNHEQFLNGYSGKIVGLTGTPPKDDFSEKGKMVNKYCPIKYSFSVDNATDNNILNDYKIVVHYLKLSSEKNIQKKNKQGGVWYTSELKDYYYNTERLNNANTQKQKQLASIMRMRSIMDYTTKERYVKYFLRKVQSKCIIFANTQKQADRICTHSYHSKNDQSEYNLELFNDGRINQLSCVSQLNEGISISDLSEGIIMHSYGNERKTAQRIGRLLRLNPNDIATCHILCYANTIDEHWVESALKTFDSSKIKKIKIS